MSTLSALRRLLSRTPRRGALAASLLLAVSSCKSLETNLQDTEVNYRQTAEQNFTAGEKALADGRSNESIKFFEHVKNKFPYSTYAVLAELRIADAHFSRERWVEAADAYRLFVRFHPRHEQVPYATWRVALAYSNAIPDDIPLLPSSKEKDQSAAREAIQALDDYLGHFPKDEHVGDAKALRMKARDRLAVTDIYVAEFYAKREKWRGALWRYQYIADEFRDTSKAPIALSAAARIARDKLSEPALAQQLLQRLVQEHPTSREAKQALLELPLTLPPAHATAAMEPDGAGKPEEMSDAGVAPDTSPSP